MCLRASPHHCVSPADKLTCSQSLDAAPPQEAALVESSAQLNASCTGNTHRAAVSHTLSLSDQSLTSLPLLSLQTADSSLYSDLLTPVGAGGPSSLSVLVPEAPEASGSGGGEAPSHLPPAEAGPDAPPPQNLLHPHR